MWLAAPPRAALAGCSTSSRSTVGSSKRSLVVVIGDGAPWIWHLAGSPLSWGRADRRSLSCQRTCVGGGSRCLWPRDSSGNGLGYRGVAAHCTGSRASPQLSRAGRGLLYHQREAACAIPSSVRKRMHLGSGEALAACKTIVSTRAKRVFHALDA